MDTELLQKYISGNATEAEKRHITEWMQEKPENMREYMAQRKLYDIALWRTLPAGVEKKKAGKKSCIIFQKILKSASCKDTPHKNIFLIPEHRV